jgi:hypothetical protein
MSTRAVIARQTSDGWEGIYQHSDGYPTGLGRELWRSLHSPEYNGDIARFLNDVIDAHPGGWSHFAPAIPRDQWDAYVESGFSEQFFDRYATRECYCHSPYFAPRDGSCAPDSKHHSESAPSGVVTYDPSADGADGLEWAYCFNEGSLTVFAALPSDVRRIGDAYQTAAGDVYQLRPHAWQVVGVFSLRGDEPNWQVVECGRSFERCPHYAWAHLSGAGQEAVRSDPRLSQLSMREYVRISGDHH